MPENGNAEIVQSWMRPLALLFFRTLSPAFVGSLCLSTLSRTFVLHFVANFVFPRSVHVSRLPDLTIQRFNSIN